MVLDNLGKPSVSLLKSSQINIASADVVRTGCEFFPGLHLFQLPLDIHGCSVLKNSQSVQIAAPKIKECQRISKDYHRGVQQVAFQYMSGMFRESWVLARSLPYVKRWSSRRTWLTKTCGHLKPNTGTKTLHAYTCSLKGAKRTISNNQQYIPPAHTTQQ